MNILKIAGFIGGLALAGLSNSVLAGEQIFHDAKILQEKQQENRHYLAPLGRVKPDRNLGTDVPSRYKRLEGVYSSVLWELTGDQTLQEAQQEVSAALSSSRYEMLFSCVGRDCGESYAWANSIFSQPLLYGNDRSQSLWTVKDRGAQRYHVFYLVERPNRRRYFYEEVLDVPDMLLDKRMIEELLDRQGYLVLGEILFHDGKPELQPLIDKIKPHVGSVMPLQLVIHVHDPAAPKDLAEQLADSLKAAGIIVPVTSVGNLAPRESAPGKVWVEWVKPDWAP